MLDDVRLLSVTCGCSFQPATFHAAEAVDEELCAPCDCLLWNDGRCIAKVIDYCAKVTWFMMKRGHSTCSSNQIETWNFQRSTFHVAEAVDEELCAPCDCLLWNDDRCIAKVVDYCPKVTWCMIKRDVLHARPIKSRHHRGMVCCIKRHELKKDQATTDRVRAKKSTS